MGGCMKDNEEKAQVIDGMMVDDRGVPYHDSHLRTVSSASATRYSSTKAL